MKVLIGYMMLSSMTLLGVLGAELFNVAVEKYRIPIDWVSFVSDRCAWSQANYNDAYLQNISDQLLTGVCNVQFCCRGSGKNLG